MDIIALLQQAAQIRDEQTPNANSASRVGGFLYEIIQALQSTVESGPYILAGNNLLPAGQINYINHQETLVIPEHSEYTVTELTLDGDLQLIGTLNLR